MSKEMKLENLKIQIFADGADKKDMLEMNKNPFVKGFTTNPTLMKKAGIEDYTAFAKDILKEIPDKDISFEVFADEFQEMERQALIISSWGKNVSVKIPVMNTKGEFTGPLISSLSEKGVRLNVTAIFKADQVRDVMLSLKGKESVIISYFAGRVADTGRNPIPQVLASREFVSMRPNTKLLWASTRELWNIFQAEECGCEIITAPKDIITKLSSYGKNLDEVTKEAVKIFYEDGQKAGFKI